MSESPDKHSDIPTYDGEFPALPLKEEGELARALAMPPSFFATIGSRPSNITQSFQVPCDEKRKFTSLGGNKLHEAQVCEDIMAKFGCTTDISVSRDGSLSVLISGKKEDVIHSKKLLLQKLQQQTKVEVRIPPDHHRIIIGKEGKNLRALQEETSTSIFLPKDGTDTVIVSGTAENCRTAVFRLQSISDIEAKRDRIILPVLKAYHPLIAGVNDTALNRIRKETGANIHVPPANRDVDEITVSGEKMAVHNAVGQLQAIYDTLKLTCSELTTNVKKSQHKYIIGRQGTNLKEIMEKTGVVVEVPPPDVPSETVTLRGVHAHLVVALTLVYEKANSCIAETLEISSWLHKYFIGAKGVMLKKLTESTDHVHLQFSDEGTGSVEIEGPPEEVALVKDNVLKMREELVKSMSFADIPIEQSYLSRLIGRNGVTITKIKDESGAKINLPAIDSLNNMIHIEGLTEGVVIAKTQILEIITKLQNLRTLDLIVPHRLHSLIIGSGGTGIKEILKHVADKEFTIDFPSKADSDIIVIKGDKKDVDKVEKLLKTRVKTLQEENFEIRIPVFKQFHKNIIGRNGATITQLKKDTNTRITVPSESADSDCIVVVGRQKDCETAQVRILAIQSEMANILDVEISIDPRFHAVLKAKIASSISQECGGVYIKFSKDPKSDKVTLNGPKDDVLNAKAQLLAIATEQALNNVSVDISVKKELHRFIIGRGGEQIKKIQEKTKVKIIFPLRNGDNAADPNIVTFYGSKAGCAEAKAIILKRVEDIENTIEATTEVPLEYHSYFLRSNVQFLKDLADEFGGVNVVIPKAGSSNPTQFSLKGGKEDIPKAIAKIQEKVEDIKAQVLVEASFPEANLSFIVGQQGKTIKDLIAKFNVRIQLPDRKAAQQKKDAEAKAVKVPKQSSKKADAVAPAEVIEAEVVEAAAPATAAETEASTDGEVAALEAGSPVAVSPSTPTPVATGPAEITIKVTGRPENCAAAVEAMKALMPEVHTIDVDNDHHRFLIGSKGESLKKLMDEHDVYIKFGRGDKCDIKGLLPNIEACKVAIAQRVKEIIADTEDRVLRSFAVTIEVDPKHHPSLIGKGGAGVKKIREDFDVQVEFPRANGDKAKASTITVSGYEKNAKDAAAILAAKAKELASICSVEVTIDPRVHSRIIGSKGATVKRMQEEMQVRINFPRDKASPIITVSGEENAVEDARAELLRMAEDFMEDVNEREQERQERSTFIREEPKASSGAQSAFVIRNAPWEETAKQGASFPSLNTSGTPSKAKTTTGPWGKKL